MMLVDDPIGACEVYLDARDGAGLHLGQTWSYRGSMFVKRKRRGEMYRRRMPEKDVSVPYSGDTVSLPVEGGREYEKG
jgi:hypothetical protein